MHLLCAMPIGKFESDIVVVGGGLAGCIAAVAAKRTNPNDSVWLIERYGFLGGMATAGYVFPFMRYQTRDPVSRKAKRLTGGLFQELMDLMHKRGYTEKHGPFYSRYDPMMFRCVLDEFVTSAGINVLFHGLMNRCTYESEENTNKRITSVVIQTKKGEIVFEPRVIIDCSGDADVVFHAGGDYSIGREEDGLTQPSTLNFRMGNVSRLAPGRYFIGKKIKAEKAKGNPLTPRNDCLMFSTPNNTEWHFNQTRVAGFDFTDPIAMTQAELEGRRQAERMIRFLRQKIPGYRKSTVVGLATQLGVRETRRIQGDYMLTEEDLLNCIQFPDRVTLGNYAIDIHDPKGTASTLIKRIPEGKFYSIPYRSLIPRGLTNVIVAGRPISATHVAHSAIRIMPICAGMGHAAGIAATLTIRNENTLQFREIDINQLQKILREQNAILE
jgi:hypothetical protein